MRALFLAAAIVVGNADVADACTPPSGEITDRVVFPEDGATGVPLDARIYVYYGAFVGDPYDTLTLRAQGGPDVACDSTTPRTFGFARLLTPTAPLAPSTTYELLDTLVLPCDYESSPDCNGAPVVIATFTTGTDSDTTAPSLRDVSIASFYYCVGDGCEDAEDSQYDPISIASVADDFPTRWVQYDYFSTDGQLLAGPTSFLTPGRQCGRGGYFPIINYLGLPSTVDLRGVDLAGNVEPTPHVLVADECDPSTCEPDAGPDAAVARSDAGCACRTSSGSGGDALLALLLVGALTPRSAARPRSRRSS